MNMTSLQSKVRERSELNFFMTKRQFRGEERRFSGGFLRARVSVAIMAAIAMPGLTGCGKSVKNHLNATTAPLIREAVSGGKINGPPGGHRVLAVGGCLKENGVRLATHSHGKPQVLLGGRPVVGLNGKPMTMEEYEAVLRKCGLNLEPRKAGK